MKSSYEVVYVGHENLGDQTVSESVSFQEANEIASQLNFHYRDVDYVVTISRESLVQLLRQEQLRFERSQPKNKYWIDRLIGDQNNANVIELGKPNWCYGCLSGASGLEERPYNKGHYDETDNFCAVGYGRSCSIDLMQREN